MQDSGAWTCSQAVDLDVAPRFGAMLPQESEGNPKMA